MNGSKDVNGTRVSCVEPNCELLRILFYQENVNNWFDMTLSSCKDTLELRYLDSSY
jgi:hypothetical protein